MKNSSKAKAALDAQEKLPLDEDLDNENEEGDLSQEGMAESDAAMLEDAKANVAQDDLIGIVMGNDNPDTNDGTDHLRETGHKGLTKQVPHKETVKVKDAWDEPVTDKAAYDESVLKDYKCSTCGVVASPEDVQKDSANQPTEA